LDIDSSGAVSLGGLFFYDDAKLQYQVNGSTRNVQLILRPKTYPVFIAPSPKDYRQDTIYAPILQIPITAGFRGAKKLKEVTVKASWRAQRKLVDKRYVMSKYFEGIEKFAFDLRDSTVPKYGHLMEYVRSVAPRNMIDPSGSCPFAFRYF